MCSTTYQLEYHCSNCDKVGMIEIPKGKLAPATAMCTNCGCETAKRHTKPNLRDDSIWRRHIMPRYIHGQDDVPVPFNPSRPLGTPLLRLPPVKSPYDAGASRLFVR